MPLGKPLTFDDEISASGKLALRHIGLRGVGYVGFFNSRRHTWHVWNSMAFRVWEEDGLGQVMFDWMSADWKAGAETAILLKPDGAARLELPVRARGEGRPRLARRGPRTPHHRSHGERPALWAPGRGAPLRAAEEGGARPDAVGLHARLLKAANRGWSSTSSGTASTAGGSGPTRARATAASRSASTTSRHMSSGSTRRSGDPRPSSTASACSTSPGSARMSSSPWAT